MENGDETFASPTTAAAEFEFDFGQDLTNGVGFNAQPAAKAYDAAEIDALREAKRDLEEKVAAICHENHFLSAEARRLEMVVSKAREDTAAAEHAAAASEEEAASLRAKVKHLQDLLATEESDREGPGVGSELASAHQEKLALEEEIKALKASAAAAAAEKEEEETAAPSAVAPKEGNVAPHGIVAAAAAGAAATAAIAVILLNLKRRSLIDTTANEFDTKSGVQTLKKSRYPKAGESNIG